MLPNNNIDLKKHFINELTLGENIESSFFIKNFTQGQTSTNKSYLNLNLADKSGQINAKIWDLTKKILEQVENHQVIYISGTVGTYNNLPQLTIKNVYGLPAEKIDWSLYTKTAQEEPLLMWEKIKNIIHSLVDEDYKWLLLNIFENKIIKDDFIYWPAAKNFHHAYLSGLLEHTLSVSTLAVKICQHYPHLNRSLLITGALLHDLGKLIEFTKAPSVDISTEGRLLGHLISGVLMIDKIIETNSNFPAEKALLLKHLIVSHHGSYEFGSAKRPKILEALVLHIIDDLDAKVTGLGDFINNHADKESGWTNYNRLFEQYFFQPNIPYKTWFEDEFQKNQDSFNDDENKMKLKTKDKENIKQIDESDQNRLF